MKVCIPGPIDVPGTKPYPEFAFIAVCKEHYAPIFLAGLVFELHTRGATEELCEPICSLNGQYATIIRFAAAKLGRMHECDVGSHSEVYPIARRPLRPRGGSIFAAL